jgi:hypothetical protein
MLAIGSRRPTTFDTASTWTGCTANTSAAIAAATGANSSAAIVANSSVAAACHATFITWNHRASPPEMAQSNANVRMPSGRY